MASAAQTAILRRVGTVLVVVGLLDIGGLIYCMANNVSYASSLNIFAVIAGLFLLRGNLGAAGLVRWFAAFLLAGLCTLALACYWVRRPRQSNSSLQDRRPPGATEL